MDTNILLLLREILRLSAAAYFASGRLAGKTDEELQAEFHKELDKAKSFNPATDIKDV
jgi:hypothetical protein